MLIRSDNFASKAVRIYSSKILGLISISVYILGTLSIVLASFSYPHLILLLLPLTVFVFHYLKKDCLRLSAKSIVHYQEKNGIWYLQNRKGEKHAFKLRANPYRSRWLVVLPFSSVNSFRKVILVLTVDALAPGDYTRLLYRLWR